MNNSDNSYFSAPIMRDTEAWEEIDSPETWHEVSNSDSSSSGPIEPPVIKEEDNILEEGEIPEPQPPPPETPRPNLETPLPNLETPVQSLFNYDFLEIRQDFFDGCYYTKQEFNDYYNDNDAHWEFQNPKNIMKRIMINYLIYYNQDLSSDKLMVLIDKR